MRILIVDDHILFRQGLSSLLKSQSEHEVVGEAGSVYEGIAKAQLLKPDLILMDYSLPDGNGVEAMDAILAEQPDCKIVFLTIQDADDTLLAAMRKGARGYLLKNMPIADLLASLGSVERGEHAMTRAMASRALDGLTRAQDSETGKAGGLKKLSPRELDVLHELANGASNQEIARRLFLSENTVKHHLHSVLEKLELENRRQAAQFAKEHGL
jgi:two-component system, NarL family, nitrate/nitrite response regulator NarL